MLWLIGTCGTADTNARLMGAGSPQPAQLPGVAPKVWRVSRPLAPGARVKVGNHYGTLVTKTPNGKWLSKWDVPPTSHRQQYGEPPVGALLADQIEFNRGRHMNQLGKDAQSPSERLPGRS